VSSSPAWPGKGGERVYGLLGFYLGGSVGGERLPVGGAPAASGGGRRGCPTPGVSGPKGQWAARVAPGEAREGRGRFPWLVVGR
jgi:hypothetical protein